MTFVVVVVVVVVVAVRTSELAVQLTELYDSKYCAERKMIRISTQPIT